MEYLLGCMRSLGVSGQSQEPSKGRRSGGAVRQSSEGPGVGEARRGQWPLGARSASAEGPGGIWAGVRSSPMKEGTWSSCRGETGPRGTCSQEPPSLWCTQTVLPGVGTLRDRL